MSLLHLGHLGRDGTPGVTLLADPSWEWEGGGGRGWPAADWPLGCTHNRTGVHEAVVAPVGADMLRLEGRVHTWRFPRHAA